MTSFTVCGRRRAAIFPPLSCRLANRPIFRGATESRRVGPRNGCGTACGSREESSVSICHRNVRFSAERECAGDSGGFDIETQGFSNLSRNRHEWLRLSAPAHRFDSCLAPRDPYTVTSMAPRPTVLCLLHAVAVSKVRRTIMFIVSWSVVILLAQ